MNLKLIDMVNKTITEYSIVGYQAVKNTTGVFKNFSNDRLIEAYDYIIRSEKTIDDHVKAVYKYSSEMDNRIVNIKTYDDIKFINDMYKNTYEGIVHGYNTIKANMEDFTNRFKYSGGEIKIGLECYKDLIDHIDQSYSKIKNDEVLSAL